MNEFDELIRDVEERSMTVALAFHDADVRQIAQDNLKKLESALMKYVADLRAENERLREAVCKIDKCFWYKDAHEIAKEALKETNDEKLAKSEAEHGWHFVTDNPDSQPDKTDDYQVLKKGDETYSVYYGWSSDAEVVAWKEQENE